MKNYKEIIIILMLFLALGYTFKLKNGQHKPVPPEQAIDPLPEPDPKINSVEPKFTSWSPVRKVTNSSLGKVLQDIDSHMPAGHQYSDGNKVTWSHETTHGINANIRNENQSLGNINGFYCLQDRACIIQEPKTTIQKMSHTIPKALRGPSYDLYLVTQTKDWNDRPLYLFDEWIAYTNGSETGRELNHQGWWYELLQAHNFNVYCMYLAMHVKQVCPEYDDAQMKAFMMWNVERTFHLARPFDPMPVSLPKPFPVAKKHIHPYIVPQRYGSDASPVKEAMDYVLKVQTLSEAESLRTFARNYFGNEWCKRIYGF